MAWQEEEEEDVETSTQGEKIENFRTEGRKKCVFFQEGSKKSLSPSVSSSSSSSYNVNRYIYIFESSIITIPHTTIATDRRDEGKKKC